MPLFHHCLASGLLTQIVWALTAFSITSALAGIPHDPAPDAREWAGRAFGGLIIVLGIAIPMLEAIRH